MGTPWAHRPPWSVTYRALGLWQKVAYISLLLQDPDTIDDALDLRGRSAALKRGQAHCLVHELRSAQPVPGIALRDVDTRDKALAVGRLHLDETDPALWIGGVDLRIQDHVDAPKEGANLAIPQSVGGEVRNAGMPMEGDEARTKPIENLA